MGMTRLKLTLILTYFITVALFVQPVFAVTCTVNTPVDSGWGTLRRCLGNAASGDIITFAPEVFPPAAPVSIALHSALPYLIHSGVTVDARSAGVILDGGDLPGGSSGLVVTSDHNVIRGVQIFNFPENGVEITDGAKNNIIGESNVVSCNGGNGIYIEGNGTTSNTIHGNSIHCNSKSGIRLENGGNKMLSAPTITEVLSFSVTGTACSYCIVEVFSDGAHQGKVYEGDTIASGNGTWTWPGNLNGPRITATATDSNGNTSEFSVSVLIGETFDSDGDSDTDGLDFANFTEDFEAGKFDENDLVEFAADYGWTCCLPGRGL
jgi:hypothetical protein